MSEVKEKIRCAGWYTEIPVRQNGVKQAMITRRKFYDFVKGVVMKQTVYTASPESQQIHVWTLNHDGSLTLVQVVDESPSWLTYDLPVDLVPTIWKGRYRGQKQKWFLMRFMGQDAQIDLAQQHPEFSTWRWIDATAMIDAIVPFKRALYEEIFAEFRDHLA